MNLYATIFLTEDSEHFVGMLEKSAAMGNPWALANLAQLLLKSKLPIPRERKIAVFTDLVDRKIISSGISSYALLGQLHLTANSREAMNFKEAIWCFRVGSEYNDPASMAQLRIRRHISLAAVS